ncbi:M48 family metallopeptidase [Arenimonas fontis]|uniref:M48 family metallopeptidase n=1 Tax=Arenimonas fontis TaxID=2608255 RepID=A0A5B2ZB64_9GAMM|nr:M48 family metallopeptidase [Arenimonas fontis]KAA2285356.1 M48 family metallopeptidase [Arenimonas fontis]
MGEALQAIWYDGRGSRGRPALLSCPAPGRLRLDSEGEVLEFAARQAELSPRLGRMPRTLRLPEGRGQLQLADSPLLDAWLPVPSRVEAVADWLERRRTAALAAAVATVAGVVFFFQVALPWMANRLAPAIPAPIEGMIGRQAMALLDRTHFQASRLPVQRREALKARFHALVEGLPRERDYRLAFRRAPSLGPNAFALPDGQVVLTDELVELAGDRDELLLAVMAHEAGHHEHRHGMRQALESSAVVVVAGFLFGDLSGAGSLSVSVPVLLLESGYSRRSESEADAFAFGLLARHGVSPGAFAEAMRRLQQAHGDRELGPLTWLSTHPAGSERIEAAERAAEDFRPPRR